MKRYITLLLIFFSIQVFGKKDISTDNLYYTCKVWGFLKYHHPNISAKDVDWDNELKGMLSLKDFGKTLLTPLEIIGDNAAPTNPAVGLAIEKDVTNRFIPESINVSFSPITNRFTHKNFLFNIIYS